jgi:hypothetical protein
LQKATGFDRWALHLLLVFVVQAVLLQEDAARNARRLAERAARAAQQAGMHTFGVHVQEEEKQEAEDRKPTAAAAAVTDDDGGTAVGGSSRGRDGRSSSSSASTGGGNTLPKPSAAEVEVLLEQARAAEQVRKGYGV